jgi:hypothetical protein
MGRSLWRINLIPHNYGWGELKSDYTPRRPLTAMELLANDGSPSKDVSFDYQVGQLVNNRMRLREKPEPASSNDPFLSKYVPKPSSPFALIKISKLFDSTRGSGQHIRKGFAKNAINDFTQYDNSYYFHNANDFVPGINPFYRSRGLFLKKGRAVLAYNQALKVRSILKRQLLFGGSLGSKRSGYDYSATNVQLRTFFEKLKPEIRLTAIKMAAIKVKIPTFNDINKAYAIVTQWMREYLLDAGGKVRPKKRGLNRYRRGAYSAGTKTRLLTKSLANSLAEFHSQKGYFYKKLMDLRKEVISNRANLRLRKF